LLWTDASVSTIIKNPVYAGHMAQHKYTRQSVNGKQKPLTSADWVIVRNTHQPIVSDELWETVQAVTKQNAIDFGVNLRKRNPNKGENLLQGLLYCPNCNKAMQRKVDTKYIYRYHFCQMKKANPNCTSEWINEAELLDVIFLAVKKEITTAADVQKLLDKVRQSKHHTERLNHLKQSIRAVNMRISRNNALNSRLFDTFADGLLTEQEFRQMKDDYASEATQLHSELAELEREHARLSSAYSKDNERIASFLKFKKQKALTRDMLVELIERIIVHAPDSIEIVWRFADEYRAVCALVKAGDVA
jgi:hypothetical protein